MPKEVTSKAFPHCEASAGVFASKDLQPMLVVCWAFRRGRNVSCPSTTCGLVTVKKLGPKLFDVPGRKGLASAFNFAPPWPQQDLESLNGRPSLSVQALRFYLPLFLPRPEWTASVPKKCTLGLKAAVPLLEILTGWSAQKEAT